MPSVKGCTGGITAAIRCILPEVTPRRDVISSGPYMIMGEDQLNISSCNTIKPISGYNPNKGVTFVRNPEYDPASDSATARPNYVDGVQIAIDSNLNDIFQKIQSGDLDGSYGDTPPSAVEASNPQKLAASSPLRTSSRATRSARSMGIAKPIPWALA